MNTPHTPGLAITRICQYAEVQIESTRHEDTESEREMLADARHALDSILSQRNELLQLLTDVGQWLEAGLTRGQISRGTANRDGDLVTQIRAAISKAQGRICGEPLFDNGKPIGVCAQPFGTEHSHQD